MNDISNLTTEEELLLSQDDFLPGNYGAENINYFFEAFRKLQGKLSGLETRIKVLENIIK
jgi:hypothetical protein